MITRRIFSLFPFLGAAAVAQTTQPKQPPMTPVPIQPPGTNPRPKLVDDGNIKIHELDGSYIIEVDPTRIDMDEFLESFHKIEFKSPVMVVSSLFKEQSTSESIKMLTKQPDWK